MVKRISIIICGILIIMMMGVGAYAAPSPEIAAEPVKAGADSQIKIPVMLKNNPGLMGYRITVSFDEKQLAVDDVAKGELINNGLFNDSLESGKNSFDVLWSGSEEVSDDGAMFYLYVRTSAQFKKNTVIKLSADKTDTFNEAFEPVELKCQDIAIEADPKAEKETFDDNPSETHVVDEITDEVRSQISDESTSKAIKKVLDKYNISDINDLKPEQAREVLTEVVAEMKAQGADTTYIEKLVKQLDEDEQIDSDKASINAVNQLYQNTKGGAENDKEGIEVTQKVDQYKPTRSISATWIIVIAAVILAAAVIGLMIYNKKKHGGISREKQSES